VSSVEGARGFVRDAREALGSVDILVPNAGGPPPGDFAHTSVDQYLDAFELNCRSAIAMCYEVVPEMRERKWGRVVAITSIAVRQPIPTLILSNTARAGLTGVLRTLAREVARDGVTVNSLLPGLHATERVAALHGDGGDPAAGVPAGRIGDPDDFGRIAAFVCSEHASYLTGAAIQVDGGAYAALL
jgi:3-oxoacyl-[acyl-carrier protein] reductase